MNIYNKEVTSKAIDTLLSLIKTGRYKEIGDDIILRELKKYLTNHSCLIETLHKKGTVQQIVKEVKRSLYKGVGAYTNVSSLKDHHSTKQRDYHIYDLLFKITGKPEHIVDLGCGLNPLSYDALGHSAKYTAIEINKEQVKQINEFFKEHHIDGKVLCEDVLSMKTFPKAEVYFLFSFLESLEQVKHHKISEWLLATIPAKNIIVSFPTYTLSGKPMRVPERRWFLLLTDRLGFKRTKIQTSNELFYILQRA